jgi:hypothetical protein
MRALQMPAVPDYDQFEQHIGRKLSPTAFRRGGTASKTMA